MDCVKRRPWQQHDVTRRGLPCTAAFAYTDYKVQGRTLDRVALQLRGTEQYKPVGKQFQANATRIAYTYSCQDVSRCGV
jgi:hypothetical protein